MVDSHTERQSLCTLFPKLAGLEAPILHGSLGQGGSLSPLWSSACVLPAGDRAPRRRHCCEYRRLPGGRWGISQAVISELARELWPCSHCVCLAAPCSRGICCTSGPWPHVPPAPSVPWAGSLGWRWCYQGSCIGDAGWASGGEIPSGKHTSSCQNNWLPFSRGEGGPM